LRRLTLFLGLVAVLATAPGALAAPVAKSDADYLVLGRVFPDPLAGCQLTGTSPCSPNAQGNFPATQFIQWDEFLAALTYMNTKRAWQRYMEVLVLDGKIGDGAGTKPGPAMFPGNTLGFLEWDPKPEYISAGLPTSTLERKKSDLIAVRVTDETVPDAGKKRYTIALSIHGIERAGLEGGTRALEDLVTAATTGKATTPILPTAVKAGAPTFNDVLRKTIIYFTYPNPDGWRRGSISEGGVFYQRYNGNGVDLNRDWPDVGYTFRPYSGASEPETRAFLGFYDGVRAKTGSGFAAGDDLHGMPGADALSYTMLPHGRHDYGKDLRLRETAKTINRATYEAVKWSPIVQSNDKPAGTCAGTSVAVLCGPIYGQTWGTVYDTINYTTTGTLGDWFDSRVGLNADGIDNEMAFSHLDRNIVFDPHGEQMHVDGNKALIYGHVADMLAPAATPTFDAPGPNGYVPNVRLVRQEQVVQDDPKKKAEPQADYEGLRGTADPNEGGQIVVPFTVYERKHKGKVAGIQNGGMRVDVTATNVQGIANAFVTLKVQCYGCDEHAGVEEEGWVTVAEDFNQSELYFQAGLTAAVNRPAGSPDGVAWRALVSPGTLEARVDVDFTSGPATSDGTTGGDEAPRLAGYDVANTDFFADLNRFIPDPAKQFQQVDPRKVISGEQSLAGLKSLVLADDALPGYTGLYDGERAPTGPPTAGFTFEERTATTPGDGLGAACRTPTSVDVHPDFTIGENDANKSMTVRIEWGTPAFDWDLFVQRKNAAGGYDTVGSATSFNILTGLPSEQVVVRDPVPGVYRIEVVNCTAIDPNYTGTVTFEALPPPGAADTGAYTAAEKDAWFDRVRSYVEGGGNLVLTDGALKGLQELAPVPASAITKQTVYAGQITFATGTRAVDQTLADPLNSTPESVRQPGARFNTGMRRQTYEPTPLGFSIQNANGDDAAGSRQYDVDRAAWEKPKSQGGPGGRTAATSADSGARNAQPVYTRVALGEMTLGAGTIRIVGALLPQPSVENDHTLGVEPYAPTYTGYILVRNLLEVSR
jgi:hypothetical protein